MIIEMNNISKNFGQNTVLKDVNIRIEGGKIHALMGENGAGKSTLMNILTGLHEKSSGTILIDGVEKYFSNPKEAEVDGISFIHQEMINWPQMTVLNNLFLNKEPKNKFGIVDTKKMSEKASVYFEELDIKDINLNDAIMDLSIGQQQMVEIIKSLMTDCKVLIMDEPTAALSDKEVEALFKIIRELKDKGVAIVYISHRMEEVFELCDEITVMRDGLSIDTLPISETSMAEVVRKMVGREITDYYPEKDCVIGEKIFEVRNLSSAESKYRNINFSVKSGEVLGFSGLMGAGRSEIMRGIFGLEPNSSGEFILEGKSVQNKTPHEAIKNGFGFLTEDRKTEGLILDFSILDNMTLPSIESFTQKGIVDTKTEVDFSEKMIQRLSIKAQSHQDIVGDLSGGNQQKVVLAKWIGVGPKVLILDEPTRGVDVGAKREIYLLINELAARGMAIIVVSSDLPEVMGISDRIIVVREGQIMGELVRHELTQEKIMTLATGGSLND